MTYPLRRKVYRRRAGALRYWMQMHVYVGVAAGLVLLLHGGRTTGGLLTSLLMVTFDAVIVTGLFGTLVYLVVPRVMTSIEGEPLLVEDLRARREELSETLAEIGQRSNEHLREFIKKKVRGARLLLRLPPAPVPPARGADGAARLGARDLRGGGAQPRPRVAPTAARSRRGDRHAPPRGLAHLPAPTAQALARAARRRDLADAGADARPHHSGRPLRRPLKGLCRPRTAASSSSATT